MNNTQFIEMSERTEKKFPEGIKLSALQLIGAVTAIQEAVQLGGTLDALKKDVIYGINPVTQSGGEISEKQFEEILEEAELSIEAAMDGEDAAKLQNVRDMSSEQIELLHHAIGMMTEAGEVLDAVFSSIVANEPLDKANLLEELGDSNWYQAGIHRLMDSSFEQVNETVIKKLEVRFPEKFTREDAMNRDLDAERKVLDESVA